jgi:hypothetical protein
MSRPPIGAWPRRSIPIRPVRRPCRGSWPSRRLTTRSPGRNAGRGPGAAQLQAHRAGNRGTRIRGARERHLAPAPGNLGPRAIRAGAPTNRRAHRGPRAPATSGVGAADLDPPRTAADLDPPRTAADLDPPRTGSGRVPGDPVGHRRPVAPLRVRRRTTQPTASRSTPSGPVRPGMGRRAGRTGPSIRRSTPTPGSTDPSTRLGRGERRPRRRVSRGSAKRRQRRTASRAASTQATPAQLRSANQFTPQTIEGTAQHRIRRGSLATGPTRPPISGPPVRARARRPRPRPAHPSMAWDFFLRSHCLAACRPAWR